MSTVTFREALSMWRSCNARVKSFDAWQSAISRRKTKDMPEDFRNKLADAQDSLRAAKNMIEKAKIEI